MSSKFNGFNHLYKQPKRGEKDDYIKRLKKQRDELEKGLEFAMTLIPIEKLPSGVSFQSLRWLVGMGKTMESEADEKSV